jgi:hypothetical protein
MYFFDIFGKTRPCIHTAMKAVPELPSGLGPRCADTFMIK